MSGQKIFLVGQVHGMLDANDGGLARTGDIVERCGALLADRAPGELRADGLTRRE